MEGKREDLHTYGFEADDLVVDEDSFRSFFEALCRRLKDPYGTTLLVKLLRFQPIDALASAVEASEQQCDPSLNLSQFIWTCLWAAIKVSNFHLPVFEGLCRANQSLYQTACEAGVRHKRIVDLLSDLNQATPGPDLDDPRNFYDHSVQQTVQTILDIYMNALVSIVRCLRAAQPRE